jgi:catechol 2,3-dioxygenase-like lactoylglutathione lyase family enzyme
VEVDLTAGGCTVLNESKLIGFIPVADPNRSRKFYVDTLGLTFRTFDGFAMVLEANGNMVRLVKFDKVTPVPYTILGWEVSGIAAAVRRLAGAGLTFKRFPGFGQDADGIWVAPNGDRVAWFEDPDGNLLSLSEHVAPVGAGGHSQE